MTATGVTGRGPALPGRLARSLRGAGLSGAALAGAGAAGALVSLRAAYPRPSRAVPPEGWPPPKRVPRGRAGSRLLAAAGLLDGRRATSHWSRIRSLERSRPQVDWVRGQRYIRDGKITTTAGVTSGVFGALRLVQQLVGAAEAQRVGRELAYPGWSLDGPTGIPAQRLAPRDLTSLLAALAPWRRPALGVGLVEGAAEIDVAAPFEVYASSFAARTVPIAAGRTVMTRHGLRLVTAPADAAAPRVDRLIVPGVHRADQVDPGLAGWAAGRGLDIELPQADGEFSFDAMLRDLAAHADRATASITAKSIEYPTSHLRLAGPAWPRRPTTLAALTLAAAIGAGFLPAAAVHRNRR
jgi:putative intracellular protease/amidase